jgi:hypothetical protein
MSGEGNVHLLSDSLQKWLFVMLPEPNKEGEACITAPVSFFHELGNLHDARITEFQWDPGKREVTIVIDDLYANFAGLPEYVRLQPARLIMSGVCRVQMDVASDIFPLRIMDFEVEEPGSGAQRNITVTFDPSGRVRIECDSIVCRPAIAD